MEELYRSKTVVVRRIASEDRSRWVVTFDNYGIGAGFDRPGFGEAFFRSRGISAIHVLGCADDWYQYEDMPMALQTVREAVAGSSRVMTYGSSMGGYAAIRFADAVGASAVLALSPQYSIDPAKTPFDDRWRQDSYRIKWLPEIDGSLVCQCIPVIVFDPKTMDGTHVLSLSQKIEIVEIPLPYSGHPATTYLQEAGLLEPLVMAVLNDTLDAQAARTEARSARKTNMAYLNELTRIQPHYRQRMALGLARSAFELAPEDPNAMWALANQLTSAGRHDPALALFERALLLAGRLTPLLTDYVNGLRAAGRIDAAHKIAGEVLAMNQAHAHVWAWFAHISWQADERVEAWKAITMAMTLDPTSTVYPHQKQIYADVQANNCDNPPAALPQRKKWLHYSRRWARERYQRMLRRRSRDSGAKPQ